MNRRKPIFGLFSVTNNYYHIQESTLNCNNLDSVTGAYKGAYREIGAKKTLSKIYTKRSNDYLQFSGTSTIETVVPIYLNRVCGFIGSKPIINGSNNLQEYGKLLR